jgi:hypothetical protein
MFLMAILKAAALQKEGQLNYIKPSTSPSKRRTTQLYKAVNNKKKEGNNSLEEHSVFGLFVAFNMCWVYH